VRTASEVRAEFDRQGITVSGWAREHGLNRWTVFEVLHGRNKGKWGEAHRAAVLLGMKEGVAGEAPAAGGKPQKQAA
jgi:gp16 family phage-associated protein